MSTFGWVRAIVVAVSLLFASPAMAISISADSPLRLIVTNDGVNPATFTVAPITGGQAYRETGHFGPGGYVIDKIPVLFTLSGTLSKNAEVNPFVGDINNSFANVNLSIMTLDGQIVFDAGSPMSGGINRSPYFGGASLYASPEYRGFITDFASAYDVTTPAHHLARLSIGGNRPPGSPTGDVGTIINGSMSSFDFAVSRFSITAIVPEPGTWALLILGFGMTGAALRSRRLQTV